MSIQIGTQVIPQINLGVNRLNQIMLGTTEIFPNLEVVVPPAEFVPISFVSAQPDALIAATVNQIPFDTTGLAVGDTVFIFRRMPAIPAPDLTVAGATIQRLLEQPNQNNQIPIVIDSFVVPAGMPNSGTIQIQQATTTPTTASIMIARGGWGTEGLDVANGLNTGPNTASVSVTPTDTSEEGILLSIHNIGSSITALDNTIPQAYVTPLPRNVMAASMCIATVPSNESVTVSPFGVASVTGIMWVRPRPAPIVL